MKGNSILIIYYWLFFNFVDDATKKKILDIIDHQFDLEIYLKYRERDIIRKEINKAQHTLRDLQAAIENGNP